MSCTHIGSILGSPWPTTRSIFFIEGMPLTRKVFVSKVRKAFSEVGLDPLKFARHSLKIGRHQLQQVRGWRTL